MKHNSPQTPKECLNRREQQLADKYHRRLQSITALSMRSRAKKWHAIWFKPALVGTFSVLVVITVILLQNSNTQMKHLPTLASVPAWVQDTQVPVAILDQLDFYDWLAQQTESNDTNTAQKQKSFTVAANQFYRTGTGRRYATFDLAPWTVRTTSDTGAVQR